MGGMRLPGLVVLTLLVLLGLGGGAALYQWQRPRSRARAEEVIAGAPLDPETRLESWIEYIGSQIQNLFYQYRVSAEQPWLVSHTVGRLTGDGAPEVWGIPMRADRHPVCVREGMSVVVLVEEPRLLARATLSGSIVSWIPDYPPGVEVDAEEQLRALLGRILEKTESGLAKDIPGTRIVVRLEGTE
jgi:hypothetical protein